MNTKRIKLHIIGGGECTPYKKIPNFLRKLLNNLYDISLGSCVSAAKSYFGLSFLVVTD